MNRKINGVNCETTFTEVKMR